jgi:hypothetical protein
MVTTLIGLRRRPGSRSCRAVLAASSSAGSSANSSSVSHTAACRTLLR